MEQSHDVTASLRCALNCAFSLRVPAELEQSRAIRARSAGRNATNTTAHSRTAVWGRKATVPASRVRLHGAARVKKCVWRVGAARPEKKALFQCSVKKLTGNLVDSALTLRDAAFGQHSVQLALARDLQKKFTLTGKVPGLTRRVRQDAKGVQQQNFTVRVTLCSSMSCHACRRALPPALEAIAKLHESLQIE